jgi:Spy/CpxP family protein refolding chaperone
MNKTRILQWLVALLILLNLSTIASLLYHNYQEKTDNEVLVFDVGSESRLNGRYFRQTLGFSNDQMDAFREANRSFQPKANMIIFSIDSLKNNIFIELKKENPDTTALRQLSEKIGNQHADLKKATNLFYLKIKTVCTSAQKEQLNEVFSPLFTNKYTGGQGMHRYRQVEPHK